MAGQMQELLLEVSRQLAGAERLLEEELEARKDSERKLDDLLERIVELEATEREREKWVGKERMKVDGRLETGDNTFLAIRQEIKSVDSVARWCRDQINAKREADSKKKTKRAWLMEKALEALIPSVVTAVLGIIWWGIYHLFLVGPRIAEAMKNHGGGH